MPTGTGLPYQSDAKQMRACYKMIPKREQVWYHFASTIADTKVLAKVLRYGLVWFDRFGIIWFARFAMFAIIWFAIGLVGFGIRLVSVWQVLLDVTINCGLTP